MTAVLKTSNGLNNQLSSVMQLDSCETLCMEHHVHTSQDTSLINPNCCIVSLTPQ